MPQRDIVVMGASAGGVDALEETVRGLRPDIRASFFIVLHFPPFRESHLPEILSRAGPLPAIHPNDGDSIQPGHIYVAPPGIYWYETAALSCGEDPKRITRGLLSIRCSSQQPKPMARE